MRDDPRRRRPYESTPRASRVHPRRKPRTRLPAIIVLIIAAVILLVVGLAGRTSDSGRSGGGETTPFSVLPVAPQNLNGSSGADRSASTTTTSTTIDSSSASPILVAAESRKGFSFALQ